MKKIILDQCPECGRFRRIKEWVYLTKKEEYDLGQKEVQIKGKTCPKCRNESAAKTCLREGT
jgi:hypothetical protein